MFRFAKQPQPTQDTEQVGEYLFQVAYGKGQIVVVSADSPEEAEAYVAKTFGDKGCVAFFRGTKGKGVVNWVRIRNIVVVLGSSYFEHSDMNAKVS